MVVFVETTSSILLSKSLRPSTNSGTQSVKDGISSIFNSPLIGFDVEGLVVVVVVVVVVVFDAGTVEVVLEVV